MDDLNVIGSRLSKALEGIKPFSGTYPDQLDDWHNSASISLSISRFDVFQKLEGPVRPSTTRSGACNAKARIAEPARNWQLFW